MPFSLEEDKERETLLLYMGMTREKEYLCLSTQENRSLREHLARV
jgi:superfamily I DNA/RNA helicase